MKHDEITMSTIHQYYLDRALANTAPGDRVLKTDAWNEKKNVPARRGIAGALPGREVIIIEKDPNIACGIGCFTYLVADIRNIRKHFSERYFDTVLDLSTLDHIPMTDTESVIRQYAHVLKDLTGRLVLFVWCSTEYRDWINSPFHDQYFFDSSHIRSIVRRFFKVETEDRYYLDLNNSARFLLHFEGTKLPWDYLQDPRMDERFKKIAAVVGDWTGLRVLDLNCGTARLRNFINGYEHYLGTDIYDDFLPPDNDRETYIRLDDAIAADSDSVPPFDVLVCAGMGGRSTSHWESATVTDSVITLTRKHQPRWVILENPTDYDPTLSKMDYVLHNLTQSGYKLASCIDVPGVEGVALSGRTIFVIARD